LLGILVWGGLFVAPGQSQEPRRLTPREKASHVLTRLAFGARPGQVYEVERQGWDVWVEQQLKPEAIDDGALNKRLAEKCPSLRYGLTELHEKERDQKERNVLKRELIDSVILRAVYSKRQLQEVLVEFWRNHFNVDVNKVPGLATHYEEHVLRGHAFGKFEDMLLATAKHPAMLVYLDNYVSTGGGLNENYARELMELHTLGVDNFYTQKDVIALARVLTGWTCGMQTSDSREKEYRYFFKDQSHDHSSQTVVGLELDGSGGMADGERAIRHLARHEGTAKFIATKLCRYLVNDQPSEELVERVAGAFRRTGGDLKEVYRAIIFSPEFMAAKNFRAKFKTPFEYTVSVLRVTDAQIDDVQPIVRELRLMGQSVYECVEPTGYYDQAEAWLDPGIMVYRWNFAIQLVTDKIKGVRAGPAFVDVVLKPTQAARTNRIMETILPGVRDTETGWFVARTGDVREMVALALGSPTFQQQ
jgi:uncharacterized protein (DUF1800 family)